MNILVLYFQLFLSFLKVGVLGFGGGFSMLSMIHGEAVVNHHWLTNGQYTDVVAVCQATPGPVGVSSAACVGYASLVNAGYGFFGGIVGALLAVTAEMLPALLVMLLICKVLMKYMDHKYVEDFLRGVRPATVGLALSLVVFFLCGDNFTLPTESWWHFLVSILIFVFALVAQLVYRLGAVRIIIICALAGIVLM